MILGGYTSPTYPASTPRPKNENIVVHGISTKAVRHLVEAMVSSPSWDHQLARWDSKLCPLVAGAPELFKGVVLSHLYSNAQIVLHGLSKDCGIKNVIIFFSENGQQSFNEILNKYPSLIKGYNSIGLNRDDYEELSRSEIEALQADRPVRWYRSTSTEPASGTIVGKDPLSGKLTTSSIDGGSRILQHTQARTTSVIVIIDITEASGATWKQLADYISFVVLAGPKLGENFNAISIMSLYNNRTFQKTAPPAMMPFDSAIIQALYESETAVQSHDEQLEITQSVISRLGSSLHLN